MADHLSLWKPVDLEKRPNHYSQEDIAKAMGFVTKAGPADSGVLAPTIRQDLDPKIYDVFVKKFPFWDMMDKIPANGLVHAYNQKISGSSPARSRRTRSPKHPANIENVAAVHGRTSM